MSKLKLNPATKKALNESTDKVSFIKEYLIKNYTVNDMTDIIATYYLDEASNIQKIKITKEQIDAYFTISTK